MSEPKVQLSGAELSPAIHTAIEVAIRLGTIALLVGSCLMIIGPFLGVMVWALIMAIAADGPYGKLADWLGGRRKLTAFLGVMATLLVLILPAIMLSETLISGARHFSENLSEGTVKIPPPPDSVAEWPLIGGRVHGAWTLASKNLGDALARVGPQLKAVSGWLLGTAGSAGAGLLQLVLSIIIAGFMLARSEGRRQAIERFAVRMAGASRGPHLAELANATVRSVVQGIVGVAVAQALLAGGGFVVAGIPGAGLWALLVLVAAVVQLPVALVMVPPLIYAFSSIDGATAIFLTIWCVFVSLMDNVLKPILFGRGVQVPSLIIFMGAIGGMLTMGIVGLFLGSVVLALGFSLFQAWLSPAPQSSSGTTPAPEDI